MISSAASPPIPHIPFSTFMLRFGQAKGKIYPLLKGIQDSYGDMAHWQVGQRFWYFNHPQAAKHILISQGLHYHKTRFTMELSGIMGTGLVTSNGALWQARRKIIQPFFKAQQFQQMIGLMEHELHLEMAELEAQIDPESELEILSLLHEMTLVLIGKALIGHSDRQAYRMISKGISLFMDYTSQGVALPRWVQFKKALRVKQARAEIDAFFYGLIDQRLNQTDTGDDFLSLLIQAHRQAPEILDRQAIRDETVTMLGAGHETTANALFWTLSLLAFHPRIQAQIQRELRAYSDDGLFNVDTAGKIPGLRAIFLEALRLYPPAWVLAREATQDDTLLGAEIRQGDQVILPVAFLQRHPSFWQEPNRFHPQRFLNREKEIRQSGYYLPFNIGPRTCVGQAFAMQEACLILAYILRKFWIEPIESTMPQAHYDILLRTPAQQYFRFRRRVT